MLIPAVSTARSRRCNPSRKNIVVWHSAATHCQDKRRDRADGSMPDANTAFVKSCDIQKTYDGEALVVKYLNLGVAGVSS